VETFVETFVGGDFLHTSLLILTFWYLQRRLKRSNLSRNHYFESVWASSQKSVSRWIWGRRKRIDFSQNVIFKKAYKTCAILMSSRCLRCQKCNFVLFQLSFKDVWAMLTFGILRQLFSHHFGRFSGVQKTFILLTCFDKFDVLGWYQRSICWVSRGFYR